jgi:hypothetical protein
MLTPAAADDENFHEETFLRGRNKKTDSVVG